MPPTDKPVIAPLEENCQTTKSLGHSPAGGGKRGHTQLFLSTALALVLSAFFVVNASFRVSANGAPPSAGRSSSSTEMVKPDGGFRVVIPEAPLLAVAICWFADVMIGFLQTESFDRKNPVASVLAGTLVRTMVILGALGFSSATKWPAHNSFGNYLVGCYFSFLALESWLAIRRSATRNYSPKPL